MPTQRPRGAALILSLTVTVISMILIVGIVQMVLPFFNTSLYFESSNQAYFAAEAGIENALYDLSEHKAGYESTGPNEHSIGIAEYNADTKTLAFIPNAKALSTSYTPGADDFNLSVPSCPQGSDAQTLIRSTRARSNCEDYNNDPYGYDISTCCNSAHPDFQTNKNYCYDAIEKIGLDSPVFPGAGNVVQDECMTKDQDGNYTEACLSELRNYADLWPRAEDPMDTNLCIPEEDTNFPGVPMTAGYSIDSLTNIIPVPGNGTSPSYVSDGASLFPSYNWNRIDQSTPLLINLSFEHNPRFGIPVGESYNGHLGGAPLKSPFAIDGFPSLDCNNTSGLVDGRQLNIFFKLPLLDTAEELTFDLANSYELERLGLGSTDDIVLSWQVSGFVINGSREVEYDKTYTLYSVDPAAAYIEGSANPIPITSVTESAINFGSSEFNDDLPTFSSNTAQIHLGSRGLPDVFTKNNLALNSSNCREGVPLGEFLKYVYEPVLKINMVNKPPVFLGGNTAVNIPLPYVEYQIRTEGDMTGTLKGGYPTVIPNTYAVVRGSGQTISNQIRQFSQQIQTKYRQDIAAPILDYTIFQ